MIRHISLDFWNTLAVASKDYAKRRAQILSDYSAYIYDGMPNKHSTGYCHDAYKAVKENIDGDVRVGKFITVDEAFRQLCEWLEIDDIKYHIFTELKAKLWDAFYSNSPFVSQDIIDRLWKLKQKGITLSIGSNTNFIPGQVIRETVLNRFGPLFDFTIFSDEVGVAKPTTKFFQIINKKVWDMFGVAGSSIVHIGDSNVFDYNPAKAFGIEAELISEPSDLPAILDKYL